MTNFKTIIMPESQDQIARLGIGPDGLVVRKKDCR